MVCKKSELTADLAEELALYHKGLDFYFAQNWNEALACMTTLQSHFPQKKLYEIYIDRIKEFISHPLPADWDGIYVHQTK